MLFLFGLLFFIKISYSFDVIFGFPPSNARFVINGDLDISCNSNKTFKVNLGLSANNPIQDHDEENNFSYTFGFLDETQSIEGLFDIPVIINGSTVKIGRVNIRIDIDAGENITTFQAYTNLFTNSFLLNSSFICDTLKTYNLTMEYVNKLDCSATLTITYLKFTQNEELSIQETKCSADESGDIIPPEITEVPTINTTVTTTKPSKTTTAAPTKTIETTTNTEKASTKTTETTTKTTGATTKTSEATTKTTAATTKITGATTKTSEATTKTTAATTKITAATTKTTEATTKTTAAPKKTSEALTNTSETTKTTETTTLKKTQETTLKIQETTHPKLTATTNLVTPKVTSFELTEPNTHTNSENTTIKSNINEPKVVSSMSGKKHVPGIIVASVLGVIVFVAIIYLVFRCRSKPEENIQDSVENVY